MILTPELRFMLLALRAQIDALLVTEAQQQERECPHPPEARVDTGAMGKPDAFHCKACGFDSEVGGSSA